MSFTITRLTAPTFTALTNDDIAQFVRIDANTDPLTIALLFHSATELVESFTNKIIATQSVQIEFDTIGLCYRLPVAPIQSITSVQYRDANGMLQALDYTRVADCIILPTLPAGCPVITVQAGYATSQAIPASIKHAIAVLVSAGYDNRTELPDATLQSVNRLLSSQRRIWLA